MYAGRSLTVVASRTAGRRAISSWHVTSLASSPQEAANTTSNACCERRKRSCALPVRRDPASRTSDVPATAPTSSASTTHARQRSRHSVRKRYVTARMARPSPAFDALDGRAEQTEADDEDRHPQPGEHPERERHPQTGERDRDADRERRQRLQRLHPRYHPHRRY